VPHSTAAVKLQQNKLQQNKLQQNAVSAPQHGGSEASAKWTAGAQKQHGQRELKQNKQWQQNGRRELKQQCVHKLAHVADVLMACLRV